MQKILSGPLICVPFISTSWEGRITYFSDVCTEVSDTLEECRECIETLRNAKNKKSFDEVSAMSDEDFANMFKNINK